MTPVTPAKTQPNSNLLSPSRLEQQEIDRIVDQIVSQLKKDNEIELTEQKKSTCGC
jgi:hypothetical protein